MIRNRSLPQFELDYKDLYKPVCLKLKFIMNKNKTSRKQIDPVKITQELINLSTPPLYHSLHMLVFAAWTDRPRDRHTCKYVYKGP